LQLPIFTNKEKERYKNNLDELDDKMDWATIKSLLQIEGIDREKVLKKSLNYFDGVFHQRREKVYVSYIIESGGFMPRYEDLNNAEEIITLVNQFLSFDEISEEDKIVLRGIVLRNFKNLISNSYYTMNTLEGLIRIGISVEDILANKQVIANNINGLDVLAFNSFCIKNGAPIGLTLDDIITLMFKDKNNIIPKEPEKLSEKDMKEYEVGFFAIKKIITELLERQGLDITAVSYLASGSYSDTIKVGEFVIKIGVTRENKEIPYSKHIIRPLISFVTNRGANIEVQNLVDARWWEIKDENGNVIRELSEEEIEEELFRVYCNLRRDGVIWKDIRKENVGRLLKRNSSNFEVEYIDTTTGKTDTYEMDISDEHLAVVGRKEGETEILSAGELVIIDRDYLNGRGAYNPKNKMTSVESTFKKRYESMEK